MGFEIDFQTLTLATAVMLLALAAAMAYVRATRRTYPGFGLWVAGAGAAGASSLLGILRGPMGGATSAVVGNTLASLGIAQVAVGLSVFLGRPRRLALQALAVAATLATSVAFTWAWPSVRARVLSGEAIYLSQVAWCLWLSLRAVAPLVGARNRLLEVVFGGQVAWGALRVLMLSGGVPALADLLSHEAAQAVTFLVFPATMAVLVIGLTVLNQQRVETDLRASMEEVHTLQGIIPICAQCKKVREGADWTRIEAYVQQHTGAEFSHGICPECLDRLYPEHR